MTAQAMSRLVWSTTSPRKDAGTISGLNVSSHRGARNRMKVGIIVTTDGNITVASTP